MKLILASALSIALLGLPGCKTANSTTPGTAIAPSMTFTQATNATLQAAHKFGMDIAASVQSGKLVLTPAQKQAFDAFSASLNATDAIFISFAQGTATQAQVTTSLSTTTSLQTSAQTALGAQ